MNGHALAAIKVGWVGGIMAGRILERGRGYRSRCECRWVSPWYPGPDAARISWSNHANAEEE